MNNFYNRVKNKPITLLSPYIKSNEKIKVRCNVCNYEWETVPPVLYRSGCPKCVGQIKPTMSEFKEKLLQVNSDLSVLSDKYVNNNTHLDVQCLKCNHEFKSTPLKLLSGNSVCQNCSSRNKQNHDKYINDFSFNENITFVGEFKDYKTKIKVKCLKCDYEWKALPSNLNRGSGCPNCFNKISSYEHEIYEIYKDLNTKRNKRFNNYEIDLFFPEHNLGIEFHGLYWHSDKFKTKQYHKEKYLACKEMGINLIQIFENEWLNKKEIVLSIVNNRLKLNNTKVYARKTTIKEVNIKEAKSFCEQNHIQGYASASIKLGLYYENELVSLITLRKNRFKNNDIKEIVRFCNKLNTNVIGGFQKLLKYIKNNLNIQELVSFVDVRYFTGSSYEKYTYLYHTQPNYFYFKTNNKLYSRQQFQKHKLKNKLQVFDENLSEYKNMTNNKYFRIFDAGNLKYLINL